jgi:membrane protein implicated in regulation of membrane protease activity
MKRHLFTVAILVAALALYSIGLVSGAMLLFAAGAACELWFWVRALGRRKGPGSSSTRTREAPPVI